MILLEEMEKTAAFRAANGECGWTRVQVPSVVAILREQLLAVLGGELWWVFDGARSWNGLIPQREGPDGVYTWDTTRRPGEPWSAFVNRCAVDTLAAVEKWPDEEIRSNLPGRILYNLTWISEAEYDESSSRAV